MQSKNIIFTIERTEIEAVIDQYEGVQGVMT